MSARGKDPKSDNSHYLIYAAAYLTAVFLLMRFIPQLAILLLVLGVTFAAVLLGMKMVDGVKAGRNQFRKNTKNDFKSRVRTRLHECKASEARFREEAETVRESIRKLRDDLDRISTTDESELERGQTLIKELQAEFNLRHAKAAFFADCATKLQQLLDRHRLQESIAARKKELEALRETNFDDEASVEETRYHLEQDSIELATITELSQDIAVSFKAEQAEELRARLEKLRGSL
ncbi:MAG: hypothetical protein AAGA31_07460 [Bacteroidota bacterium]